MIHVFRLEGVIFCRLGVETICTESLYINETVGETPFSHIYSLTFIQ